MLVFLTFACNTEDTHLSERVQLFENNYLLTVTPVIFVLFTLRNMISAISLLSYVKSFKVRDIFSSVLAV